MAGPARAMDIKRQEREHASVERNGLRRLMISFDRPPIKSNGAPAVVWLNVDKRAHIGLALAWFADCADAGSGWMP